jgi:serine/threonine-protein kinase
MPDPKAIDDLLLEWESAWRAGRTLTPQELCPDWPEGQAELHRRAALLRKFDAFAADEVTTEPHTGEDAPPTIPGYAIRGVLGAGGMGVVYRARQESLHRDVAVKVMRGGPDPPPRFAHLFAQEARLLAQLKHDNLVPVFDAKLHLGRPYFVMELIQGGSLADAVDRFAHNPAGAAELVELVARVVHYAHQQGVLHRDLKPHNILLDERGRPRVSDFGLAKIFSAGPEAAAASPGAVTATGPGMGTPPYMAPEQFRSSHGPITPRTDVWALGVILYELLTGRRPFAPDRHGNYEVPVCESVPVPPRSLRPKLDRDLEAIVFKCLEKNPARRYATAAEMAEDLAAWRRGDFPKVSSATWPRRMGRRARRYPVLAASFLVAPILVALAIAFAVRQQPGGGNQPDPDLALKEIEGNLANGEEVELIGKTGPPKWFHTAVGSNHTHTFLAGDGTFTVDSWEDLCLVELVRDPQRERYVITAKVRHEKGSETGEVGIYCGRYYYNFDRADANTYIYLGFNDVVDEVEQLNRLPPPVRVNLPQPTANRVYFPFRLVARRQDKKVADDILFDRSQGNIFKPAGSHGGSWRTLVLKVGLDGVEAEWGEKEFVATIPTKGLAAEADKALLQKVGRSKDDPGLEHVYPNFPCRGGLGLYVRNSSASFCSVSVAR